MPKGDREKLKADPEDGTTPVANLLVTALAIAKLTSKEKSAILFLWRRTYGWHENGTRFKEVKISFQDWNKVLGIDNAHTSTLLATLVKKRILLRRYYGPTGEKEVRGYYYALNTKCSEWSDSCLNQQLLRKLESYDKPQQFPKLTHDTLPKTVTVSLPKTVTIPHTSLATPKSILNKLNKRNTDQNTNNKEGKFRRPYRAVKKRVTTEQMKRAAQTTISGQTIENAIAIARGEISDMPEKKIESFRAELNRRGIPWRKKRG